MKQTEIDIQEYNAKLQLKRLTIQSRAEIFLLTSWERLQTASMRHDKDNEILSDAIHVVYVELSTLQEIMKKTVSKMTDLEQWAVFFQYASEQEYRDTVNDVIETKEELKMAGELLMSISQAERKRAIPQPENVSDRLGVRFGYC